MKEKHSDLILTSLKTYFNHQFQNELNKDLTSETGTTSETSYFVSAEEAISSVKRHLGVTFKYMLDF